MDKFKELIEKIKKSFVEKAWLKWVAIGVAAVLIGVILLCSLTMCKGDDNVESSSGKDSVVSSGSITGDSSIGGGNSGFTGDSSVNNSVEGDSSEDGSSIGDNTSSDDHDHSHGGGDSSGNSSDLPKPPEVNPDDEVTGDANLLWTELKEIEGDKYYVIKGIGAYTAPKLVIPTHIYDSASGEYVMVKEIAENAFYDCKTLKIVEVSDTVMRIGRLAFASCVNLHTVEFGRMLSFIGWGAFDNCDNIRTAIFNEPNGWSVTTATDWQNSKGTPLSASDLSDSAKAAYLLVGKGQYNHYYWKRAVI